MMLLLKYHWYVPRFWKSYPRSAIGVAGHRQRCFDPNLNQALVDYWQASRRRDFSRGLYFDPFLSAEGDYERYWVGAMNSDGKHFLVSIYGIRGG